MIQSFNYWVDNRTRILIVGTMPSVASLGACQYYAHPRNHFWPIMSALLNDGRAWQSYDEKRDCLLSHGVGLWDALRVCTRPGSLDAHIENEEPNDFVALLSTYPQIERFLFNGQKAYQFFKKYNGALLCADNHLILPSTSPANAMQSFDKKLAYWRDAVRI